MVGHPGACRRQRGDLNIPAATDKLSVSEKCQSVSVSHMNDTRGENITVSLSIFNLDCRPVHSRSQIDMKDHLLCHKDTELSLCLYGI